MLRVDYVTSSLTTVEPGSEFTVTIAVRNDSFYIDGSTEADEIGLKKLARQISAKKVFVKLFLRHSLHAKLYLLFREDPISQIIGVTFPL